MKVLFSSLVIFFLSIASTHEEIVKESNQTYIVCKGRYEKLANGNVKLISSAASISFSFKGNECSVNLKNEDSYDHHDFVSLVLDGEYIGRLEIEKGRSKSYPIKVTQNRKIHNLTIYKATEARNGTLLFSGTTAAMIPLKKVKKKKVKIEFIGNSITCGYGNDSSEIPCHSGEWYDQHNAYLAYGPILSRALEVNFLVSAVSGIGIYRNWNHENKEAPTMPEVYENLYLNEDASKPYPFDFHPDIVSICLGTNDLSNSDGKKQRLPFDKNKFIENYVAFIKKVYKHNPKAQIVLLSSPMLNDERNEVFMSCLKKIIKEFETDEQHKKIAFFEYEPMQPKGCDYHPDIEDHKVMAKQLEPFFKKLVNEANNSINNIANHN